MTTVLTAVLSTLGLTVDVSGCCKALTTAVRVAPVAGSVTLRTPLIVTGTHSPGGTVLPGHDTHSLAD